HRCEKPLRALVLPVTLGNVGQRCIENYGDVGSRIWKSGLKQICRGDIDDEVTRSGAGTSETATHDLVTRLRTERRSRYPAQHMLLQRRNVSRPRQRIELGRRV